ncbi:MAG TPA: RNA polymerase sigma factor [Steroidobacteraceae bacterium]|nr:RNA polymerase sigma factor [Steroidobacteraceae bacterium]
MQTKSEEAARLCNAPVEAMAASAMNESALNAFLRSVERRALRMAQMAVRDRDDALDIVQDAMLTLVRKYRTRSPEDWRPLFHRILQSRITDHYRRRAVRQKIFGWLATPAVPDDEMDVIGTAPDPHSVDPAAQIALEDGAAALARAVARLPLRQQQAFLLRTWEGLDVAATAAAMGCSEGSVKTHYSRAMGALQPVLEEHFG